jgi:hypothetical protein
MTAMRRTTNLLAALASILLLGFAPAPEWKEYVSKDGRYKVQLPGTPMEKTQKVPGAGDVLMVVYELKDGAYLANFTDIPGAAKDSAEMIDKRLDGARDGAAGSVGGKVVKEEKITLDKKYPGREIQIELPGDKGLLRARYYWVEGRLYQTIVVGTKAFVGGDDTKKFLDSFALTK